MEDHKFDGINYNPELFRTFLLIMVKFEISKKR
jgi:hypothetical protein